MLSTPPKHYLLWLLLCAASFTAGAQKFWLLTNEFQLGPKTGIAARGDSSLFVSGVHGIIHSYNRGQQFDTSLRASVVHSIFATQSGVVLAGGTGKIFRSINQGASWDSISTGTNFPVTKFIENSTGQLFAATAQYNNGFEGAGIYYSADTGKTWSQRNTGLGNFLCIEGLVADRNNRLYLTAADENITGNAGLFISDNNGLQWQHISIRADGNNVIDNDIKIGNTSGLSISPQDSLYFSFTGVAVNVAVYANLVKHINDVTANSFWLPFTPRATSQWWSNAELNDIHFARNGDRYSSFHRLLGPGGTYFSKAGGTTWQNIKNGLGYDITSSYNKQYFAELPDGTVYMVQAYDERVYVADTSVVLAIPAPQPVPEVRVYPIPAAQNIFVDFAETQSAVQLRLLDLAGRAVATANASGEQQAMINIAALNPGVYLLEVSTKGYPKPHFKKVVVQ